MSLNADQKYQNMNVIANAITLVERTVRHINSDDLKMSVEGEALSPEVLNEAIAARLQRRLKSHQYNTKA